MTKSQTLTIDGNQAAAEIAHMTNEVIAIYPITPASPMGEWADVWSARKRPNIWGTVPRCDVVITAHQAGPEELERSLVGTAGLVGSGRITVIDAEDIARSGVRTLQDLLGAEAGVAYRVIPQLVVSAELAFVFGQNVRPALGGRWGGIPVGLSG